MSELKSKFYDHLRVTAYFKNPFFDKDKELASVEMSFFQCTFEECVEHITKYCLSKPIKFSFEIKEKRG